MSHIVSGRTYLTHGFDRYPAKMIPHLARFAIENFTKGGQSILDPFCGCGTVLLESIVAGRRSTGIDVNPLAVLLTKAKTNLYDVLALDDVIKSVLDSAGSQTTTCNVLPTWINYWFSKKTLERILLLKNAIICAQNAVDESTYIEALLAILSKTIRLCSVADPRSPKPFISKKAKTERVGVDFDAFRIFRKLGEEFMGLSKEFNNQISQANVFPATVHLMDTLELHKRKDIRCFDAIVTSPPYLSAQDYYRSSKLEIAILGLLTKNNLEKLGPKILGSGRGKIHKDEISKLSFVPPEINKIEKLDRRSALVIANYINNINVLFQIFRDLLNNPGSLCLIIGNSTIRNIYLPIHEWVIEIGQTHNLLLKEHYIDTVRDRKVPPQRLGHSSVIRQEHILLFRSRN